MDREAELARFRAEMAAEYADAPDLLELAAGIACMEAVIRRAAEPNSPVIRRLARSVAGLREKLWELKTQPGLN
jgi:hypothetical protein